MSTVSPVVLDAVYEVLLKVLKVPDYVNFHNCPTDSSDDVRPLRPFMETLVRKAQLTDEVVLSAGILANRFHHFYPQAKGARGAGHRIFLTTCILATKLLWDRPFKNSSWARAAGIFSLQEINAFERELLSFLNYDVHICCTEYRATLAWVHEHARRRNYKSAQASLAKRMLVTALAAPPAHVMCGQAVPRRAESFLPPLTATATASSTASQSASATAPQPMRFRSLSLSTICPKQRERQRRESAVTAYVVGQAAAHASLRRPSLEVPREHHTPTERSPASTASIATDADLERTFSSAASLERTIYDEDLVDSNTDAAACEAMVDVPSSASAEVDWKPLMNAFGEQRGVYVD